MILMSKKEQSTTYCVNSSRVVEEGCATKRARAGRTCAHQHGPFVYICKDSASRRRTQYIRYVPSIIVQACFDCSIVMISAT